MAARALLAIAAWLGVLWVLPQAVSLQYQALQALLPQTLAAEATQVQVAVWLLQGPTFQSEASPQRWLLMQLGGALLLLLYAFLRRGPLPLRQLAALLGAAIAIVVAVQGLFPQLGYTANQLSQISLFGQASLWVALPLIAGLVGLAFPHWSDQLGMLAWTLLFLLLFGLLRMGFWAIALEQLGLGVAPYLYFLSGFWLDVLAWSGFYSWQLYFIAKRRAA